MLKLYNDGILSEEKYYISVYKFQVAYNFYILFLQSENVVSLFKRYNKDHNNFKQKEEERYNLINKKKYPIKSICNEFIPFSKFFKDTSYEKIVNNDIIKKFNKIINDVGLEYFENALNNTEVVYTNKTSILDKKQINMMHHNEI